MQQFLKLVSFSALSGWVCAQQLAAGDTDSDAVVDELKPCDREMLDRCEAEEGHTLHYNCLNNQINCLRWSLEVEKAGGEKELEKLLEKSPRGGGLRSLQRNNMGLVDRYGCWCYFENDHGLGQGAPVDNVDTICQVLHKGYECILLDNLSDANGATCDPWTVQYASAFGSGSTPFGLDMENLANECDAQNLSPCEAAVCKVEGNFVLTYFKYAVLGGLIDMTKRHELGFDTAVCLTPRSAQMGTGHTDENMTCCGTYPIRFPYWHETTRQCCQATNLPTNSLTFNPDNGVCCPDTGTIEVSSGLCG